MLTLYVKTGCPFCARVLDKAGQLDLDLELKNIADEATANELVQKGGQLTVPYLVDSDKSIAMYESDDIIDYLEENYGH